MEKQITATFGSYTKQYGKPTVVGETTNMTQQITTLELHSLKELVILRRTIQDRMNYLKAIESELPYKREDTIEYLTLGQILVRLPEPAQLTPQICTQDDIPS